MAKSLRGAAYFRVYRGVLVACKWPRPRGKPRTPEHRQQVAWFTHAQKVASRVDAKLQMEIRQAFAGTPLMPRDVATSLMAGRMYSLRGADGLYIRSKRAMNEVSRALDVISDQPGNTLVRGADAWTGQPPITAAGRWIWPMPELAWTASVSTANLSWLGSEVIPGVAIVITQIGGILNAVAGGQYRAAVAHLDGSRVVDAWTQTSIVTPSSTGRQMLGWALDAVLTAGERYALVVGRTDVPDGTDLGMVGVANTSYPWPGERSVFAGIEASAPGIGSPLEGTGSGAHAVGVLASF